MTQCKSFKFKSRKSKLINFFLLSWILIELRIFVDLGTRQLEFCIVSRSQKQISYKILKSCHQCHFRSSRPARRKAPGRMRPATLLKKRLCWHRCFPVNFVQNVFGSCWLLSVSVTLSFSLMLYSKFSGFRYFFCILLSPFV